MDDIVRKLIILICTYRRPQLLIRCLESLRKLRSEGIDLRLAVVDNDASGSASHVIRTFSDADLHIIYEIEPRNGAAYARERCLQIVRREGCDYFAFTDDDCIATEDWIFNSVKRFEEDPGVDWINGLTVNGSVSLLTHVRIAPQARLAARRITEGCTNNLILRRDCSVQSFDPFFAQMGGEDRHFTLALSRRGFCGVSDPSVVIVEPVRADKDSARERLRRISVGAASKIYGYSRNGLYVRALLTWASSGWFLLLGLLATGLWCATFWHPPVGNRAMHRATKYLGRALGYALFWQNTGKRYFSPGS